MKVKAHFRVAKNGHKHVIAATKRPNHSPLQDSTGNWLPTVAFAANLEIPDEMFRQAEQVIAEIKIPDEQIQIAAEVSQ